MNNLIVRKLTEPEKPRGAMVMAAAFEGNFSFDTAATEKKEDVPDLYPRTSDRWAALSPDEKTVYSTFDMNHYTVSFDGHSVKMGGVGGVATLPAFRKKGGVRACFAASFQDLYQQGFAFSTLYPFSDGYYRQFGYECGAAAHTYTVPMDSIRLKEQGGTIEQLLPGDDTAPLLELYNAFYKDYNLATQRQVFDKDLAKENPFNQQRYIFVWRDDVGTPQGFFISHKDKDGVLDLCTTFQSRGGLFATSPKAFAALFYFIKTAYAAYCKSVRFTLPAHMPVAHLFAERNPVECRRSFNAMVRIVDVKQVLSLCKCQGEGTITLAVTDPLLKENCKTFALSFAPKKANTVQETTAAPDITLGIGDLSVLLCGIRTAAHLDWLQATTVHNPNAPFSKVFYQKNCYLLELF